MYKKVLDTVYQKPSRMNGGTTCDCAWCRIGPQCRTTLPLVFRIRLGEHFVCWGWVIDVQREECVIFIRNEYETILGLRNVVEECATLFPATFTEAQKDQIAKTEVKVSWDGHTVPWSHISSTSLTPARDFEILPRITSAMCQRTIPQEAQQAPRLGRKPKRLCNRPSPQKEERAPSPMVVETSGAAAYDIRSIGGVEVDVLEAHSARPMWDAEIVMEMMRHGAHPPLKEIRDVVHRQHHREAECVFIHPTGVDTPPIFIPMSIILSDYRDMAGQYVR